MGKIEEMAETIRDWVYDKIILPCLSRKYLDKIQLW
jgi:hypothetical protein